MTAERKKQLDTDLWIISLISLSVLGIYIVLGNAISDIVYNPSINIVLRVLFVGGCFQFGLAGLGMTVVSILRKESFRSYGLTTNKLIPTIALSVVCCLPSFIYKLVTEGIDTWFPFIKVNTTVEVLESGFPYNVIAFLVTAICWGFFEGFNYAVIGQKVSERYPTKSKYWDIGALVCAIICILVHGAVGVTPNAIIEMLCTMFLIYGMLIVRKNTGNAWGCILIFLLYWNAL